MPAFRHAHHLRLPPREESTYNRVRSGFEHSRSWSISSVIGQQLQRHVGAGCHLEPLEKPWSGIAISVEAARTLVRQRNANITISLARPASTAARSPL
jgi:hypothetical protein